MKLSLKLANATLTFEVTGSISVQYTSDGMEIIEATNGAAASVPAVQKVCNTELQNADSSSSVTRISTKDLADITDIIKRTSTDSDILGVRKLLGQHLSDKQFNDIITALDIYAQSLERVPNATDWNQKIKSLMCTSMLILAGYKYGEAAELLDGDPMSDCINEQIYTNLRRGKPCKCYQTIAELLWPEIIYRKEKGQRSHSDSEIQKFQKIVDALECGYSFTAIAKFTNTSVTTVQSVRHNKSWANKYIEYSGIYPIGTNITMPEAAKKLSVHVCDECGCVIPAKRILAMPNAKCCVHCQTRKDETYRQQFAI